MVVSPRRRSWVFMMENLASAVRRVCVLLVTLALVTPGEGVKQSFRVSPQDLEVVVGHDAVLRCEVNNQQGEAQWTRHGFAMGFDRNLTGLSRYSMVGDASAGVHDLRISNVSLEDDGEFQCQVTPYNNARQIRAAAVLTVLVPPGGVAIEGSAPEVTVVAGQSVLVVCKVPDAKPAATVAWLKNGDPYTPENEDSSESDGSNASLKTRTSKITLTPSPDDNGANFTCLARHPALTIAGSRLQTSVVLNVQYAPGAPEVNGFREGEVLNAGDTRVLSCRSRGGNPLPDVYWFKNGQQLDKTFEKHVHYAVNNYEFEVTAADNRAVYECRAHNSITSEPKSTSVSLRVNFPPESVAVKGPDSAKVGDVIALSCVATNSNPAADVSLVVNGHTPPGTASNRIRTENWGFTTMANLSSYEVQPMDKDLVVACYAHNQPLAITKVDTKTITILRPPGQPVIIGYDGSHMLRKGHRHRLTCVSNGGNPLATLTWYKGDTKLPSTSTRKNEDSSVAELDIVLQESDNGATYKCEARNDASSEPLTNSTTLTVAFPPASVQVTVTPASIHAGHNITLKCDSSSSYPTANVTWWRDGAPIMGGQWKTENGLHGGTMTSYSINMTVASEDDGAVFTCQAGNDLAFTTHDSLTLDIKYAPVFATDALPDSVEVTEGQNVSLNANVVAKPSTVSYTWHFGSELIASTSILNITNITRAQDGVYTVKATNSEGSTTKDIAVKVKFAPSILSDGKGRTVNKNDIIELACTAEALPVPSFTWHRGDEDISSKATQTGSTSLLVLRNITASDTGRFLCKAKNDVGEDSANFTVVVNNKPVMDSSGLYDRAGAELGGTATLKCRATGSPAVSFTWFTRDNTPIEEALYSRFQNRYSVTDSQLMDGLATYESVLKIVNVTMKDQGIFQCQAMNSLGYTNTIVTLEGTTAPNTPSDFKVVNTTHDSALLQWVPGYNGGLTQSFRIRYRSEDTEYFQYADVFPGNSSEFVLTRLERATTYLLAVQAFNSKGESGFTENTVRTTTKSTAPESDLEDAVSDVSKKDSSVASLLAIIITLVGAILLILNLALVICYFKRRSSKRLASSTKGSIDKGSNKSTTMEMYAPSSYNGTVNAETLSSISEKSRTSTGHEDDSVFDVSDVRTTASPNYLIDRLDPPVQYASQGPLQYAPSDAPMHSLGQTQLNKYDLDSPYNIDMSNQNISTLDRRGNLASLQHTQPPHQSSYMNQFYSKDNSMNRHNNSLSRSGYHASENPYPRTQAPKLQFPKDYIRNGSAMNSTLSPSRSGVGGSLGLGYTSSSPDQMTPPELPPPRTRGHPMLTTFSGDHIASTTLPMEQRGHLV